MTTFKLHTLEAAPAGSRPLLAASHNRLGFVPNLHAVFAESPAALEAYQALSQIFDKAGFSPTERQIVLLTTSFENECEYCMAAHTRIAGMQSVPEEIVGALRNGEPLADPKLEALRGFTRKVVRRRGWVDAEDVQAFLDAGYPQAAVLEVILGVSFKTLANYTNHVARPPLDPAFQPAAWSPTRAATT